MEINLVEVSLSEALMELSIREHRRIVDGLRAKNPDRAAMEMRAHISATRDRTAERLRAGARYGESTS
jgi:DNA-binding GntR family transcriptional regulator